MNWPMIPLGDLCSPKQWPTLSKAQMSETGHVVYGANGPIGFSEKVTHRTKTVLIGCRGSCGSVHVIPAMSYANGNAMALDRLDERKVDLEYLVLFLRARGFEDVVTGSSQPQIIRSNIVRIKVPLPPLDEQRRIAAILNKADSLRRKRKRALELLEGLTVEIFRASFSGYQSPALRLSDAVRSGTIVTYGIVQAGEEHEGGVPYIRTGDISEGQIKIEGLRHTNPSIAAKFQRSRVQTGEIVMSIRATVGTTAIVPPELDGANLTQGTARIAPGSKVTLHYLLNYLRSNECQAWIQAQVKGATFREITLKRLRELEVSIPPMLMQEQFEHQALKIAAQIQRAKSQLSVLEANFDSLQLRAFSGEL